MWDCRISSTAAAASAGTRALSVWACVARDWGRVATLPTDTHAPLHIRTTTHSHAHSHTLTRFVPFAHCFAPMCAHLNGRVGGWAGGYAACDSEYLPGLQSFWNKSGMGDWIAMYPDDVRVCPGVRGCQGAPEGGTGTFAARVSRPPLRSPTLVVVSTNNALSRRRCCVLAGTVDVPVAPCHLPNSNPYPKPPTSLPRSHRHSQ